MPAEYGLQAPIYIKDKRTKLISIIVIFSFLYQEAMPEGVIMMHDKLVESGDEG